MNDYLRTNVTLNSLTKILSNFHHGTQPVPAAPFDSLTYSPGVHRYDSTRFFRSHHHRDLLLVENWQKLANPSRLATYAHSKDPEPTVLSALGDYSAPRFMISTDKDPDKRYAVFDRWKFVGQDRREFRQELLLNLANINTSGSIDPFDVPDPVQMFQRNQLVYTRRGLFCLTPDEPDDSRRLYLRFLRGGERAILQLGPDMSEAMILSLVATFPNIAADGEHYEDHSSSDALVPVSPIEVALDQFLEQDDYDWFFSSASFYLHSDLELKNQIRQNPIDDMMSEINELIGLENIKQQIKDFAHFQNWVRVREHRGLPVRRRPKLHAIFSGNPGTGKTTVAQMLGTIYRKLGLLSKGHVVKVDRSDLVAKYIGQTAHLTKEAIEKARGGVLFVDEAYAFARAGGSEQDFGHEAIEILMQEMSDGQGDIAIIFAGYPNEMASFTHSNPGIRSRINTYEFKDYTVDELLEIADAECRLGHLHMTDEARDYLKNKLTEVIKLGDHTLGNARLICDSLLPQAQQYLARRLSSEPDLSAIDDQQLSTLTKDDFEYAFSKLKIQAAPKRLVVRGFDRH